VLCDNFIGFQSTEEWSLGSPDSHCLAKHRTFIPSLKVVFDESDPSLLAHDLNYDQFKRAMKTLSFN